MGNMKTAQQELATVAKKKKPEVPKMLISFYNQSEKKRKLTGKIDSGSNCQTSASTENGSFASEKGRESQGLPEIERGEKILEVDSVTPENRTGSRQGKDIVIRRVAMSKSQLKSKNQFPRETSPNYSQLLRESLSTFA